MKKFLGFVGVLGILAFGPNFTGNAFANLTKQDIEEIRKIVREEIQREIQHVNTRIDDLNTRIDDLNTRIDDLDNKFSQRINDMMGIILGGFGILFAGMFALVGFVLWDRRSALAPAVREMKALEERENRLERILREYAQKEPQLAAIMRSITL